MPTISRTHAFMVEQIGGALIDDARTHVDDAKEVDGDVVFGTRETVLQGATISFSENSAATVVQYTVEEIISVLTTKAKESGKIKGGGGSSVEFTILDDKLQKAIVTFTGKRG